MTFFSPRLHAFSNLCVYKRFSAVVYDLQILSELWAEQKKTEKFAVFLCAELP